MNPCHQTMATFNPFMCVHIKIVAPYVTKNFFHSLGNLKMSCKEGIESTYIEVKSHALFWQRVTTLISSVMISMVYYLNLDYPYFWLSSWTLRFLELQRPPNSIIDIISMIPWTDILYIECHPRDPQFEPMNVKISLSIIMSPFSWDYTV